MEVETITFASYQKLPKDIDDALASHCRNKPDNHASERAPLAQIVNHPQHAHNNKENDSISEVGDQVYKELRHKLDSFGKALALQLDDHQALIKNSAQQVARNVALQRQVASLEGALANNAVARKSTELVDMITQTTETYDNRIERGRLDSRHVNSNKNIHDYIDLASWGLHGGLPLHPGAGSRMGNNNNENVPPSVVASSIFGESDEDDVRSPVDQMMPLGASAASRSVSLLCPTSQQPATEGTIRSLNAGRYGFHQHLNQHPLSNFHHEYDQEHPVIHPRRRSTPTQSYGATELQMQHNGSRSKKITTNGVKSLLPLIIVVSASVSTTLAVIGSVSLVRRIKQ